MLAGLAPKRTKYFVLPGQESRQSNHVVDLDELDDDDFEGFYAHDDDSVTSDAPVVNPVPVGYTSDAIQKSFYRYLQKAGDFAPLTGAQENAINLLLRLRETKASLCTYDVVMRWHLETKKLIRKKESLKSNPHFISKEKIFALLSERYNMEVGFRNVTEIVLPSTKAKATMVWNSAPKVIESLLTDPRIHPEHYLFFNNDPFAPPPEDLNYIADLNTGKCYIETYKALITDPTRQVLCPTPLYIDGAATGQFVDLPLTAVKISLGIFNREARDQGHFWGTLGYIPNPTKLKSQGHRQMADSGHTDGTLAYHELLENEGELDPDTPIHSAQDLHTMLETILASYVKMQKEGFKWDLFYNGKIYRDIEFVFFVPFIKCDTDEADKLCGSYTCRNKNVSQLCRYCKCPTKDSDDPFITIKPKLQHEIQALVEKNNLEKLKKLSQHCINNSLYSVRFGLHNRAGVHGACPIEMLHGLLLGIFVYVRNTFFTQIGETSKLAKQIEGLAIQYGHLLSRQSDRDKPKTKFYAGIRRGKLMAKEYTGILLVLLCAIRCDEGKRLLQKRKFFRYDANRKDWIMLLETLLQWEAWLKSPKMSKNNVTKSRKKHQYIMQLMKKISRRTKGMGLKTTKFHAILHLVDDIRAFGVPMEVDTGSNESHHKPAKNAAKLTQKIKEKFEEQTAKRLEEMHLLKLAEAEMEGRPLWRYYYGQDEPDSASQPPTLERPLNGKAFLVTTTSRGHNVMLSAEKIEGKHRKVRVEEDLIDFLVDLQDQVEVHIGRIQMKSVHKREGVIFRGHMTYRGSVWRDWVMVDWDGYGHIANRIWGFVDLTRLPNNSGINYGGLSNLVPAVYAIVESSIVDDIGDELISEIHTEISEMTNGYVTKMKYYLADVEAFVQPAIVVPNIGGPNNSYLQIKNRTEWRQLHIEWLNEPHNNQHLIEPEDDSDDDEEISVASAETEAASEVDSNDEEDDSSDEEDNEEAVPAEY